MEETRKEHRETEKSMKEAEEAMAKITLTRFLDKYGIFLKITELHMIQHYFV